MTVCEVEVYKRNATGGEDDTPYDENIAVSRSVTVSTNEAANFHITNGKYENAWQVIDAGASPMAEGWFIVDLGDVMSFNNIITAWDMGAYATDYELLISEMVITILQFHIQRTGLPIISNLLEFSM